MALHVLILLQVTAVIVKKDILETTVKQMRTTSQDNSYCLRMFLSIVVISLVHECITFRDKRSLYTGTSRELNHAQSMYKANSISYRFEVFMFLR